MDMESRRRFVNSMMAATAAAMGGGLFGGVPLFGQEMQTVPEGGPPYLPTGGVQVGPDGVNGNPPPGPIGGPMAPAGAQAGGRRGGRGGGAARPPRPMPAGIYWISGTGIERQPGVNTWDIKDHTKLTMDNVKRGVEARGGTMDSFLYMQVFFCLRSDDSTPMPKGSAAFAAYQKYYTDLGSVYSTYWPNGAPPRSCFALSWIPGSSLIEVGGAAYLDPSVVPPPRAPRGGGPA